MYDPTLAMLTTISPGVPSSFPNLHAAWAMWTGQTPGTGSKIASIAGAWGTSLPLAQATSANQFTNAAGLGPDGRNIVKFDKSVGQYGSFTETGVMTSCTLFVVFCPRYASATTLGVFGRSTVDTSYVTIKQGTGNLFVRTVGAGADVEILLPGQTEGFVAFNKQNLQVLILSYTTAGGGTITPYLNGRTCAPTTGVGTGGFNLGRIGSATGTATNNPFDGFMMAAGIYSGSALSADQAGLLNNFLITACGRYIYIDPVAGSDSSLTPWAQSTPLQTLSTAVQSNQIRAGQVFTPKRGSLNRLAHLLDPADNISAVIDGDVWGDPSDGFAELRFSKAPVPTEVSPGVWDLGILYYPSVAITAITKAAQAQVTLSDLCYAEVGSRLKFSAVVGMTQINGLTGTVVTVVDSFNFVVNINSSGFSTYTSAGVIERIAKPHAGTAGGAPTNFVYNVPGGEVIFDGPSALPYKTSNVGRWEEQASTNTPDSETWSYYTTDDHIYVGSDDDLEEGDIEVPMAPERFHCARRHSSRGCRLADQELEYLFCRRYRSSGAWCDQRQPVPCRHVLQHA
jgi:hypothetical protein